MDTLKVKKVTSNKARHYNINRTFATQMPHWKNCVAIFVAKTIIHNYF
ncbi:Hypothetical cytosolic protein [Lactobacillus helveticus H10]|nr:Hypothetical cytosolic protein [Lactobacillus helveticus H10]